MFSDVGGSVLDYSITRFRWSLQALAAPADIQLELFSGHIWKVDELAIEFDQWYQVIKKRRAIFTPQQQKMLENLNRKLDDISGPENVRYWFEETLRTDAVWEEIRLLAREVLHSLGWPTNEDLRNRGKIPVNM